MNTAIRHFFKSAFAKKSFMIFLIKMIKSQRILRWCKPSQVKCRIEDIFLEYLRYFLRRHQCLPRPNCYHIFRELLTKFHYHWFRDVCRLVSWWGFLITVWLINSWYFQCDQYHYNAKDTLKQLIKKKKTLKVKNWKEYESIFNKDVFSLPYHNFFFTFKYVILKPNW